MCTHADFNDLEKAYPGQGAKAKEQLAKLGYLMDGPAEKAKSALTHMDDVIEFFTSGAASLGEAVASKLPFGKEVVDLFKGIYQLYRSHQIRDTELFKFVYRVTVLQRCLANAVAKGALSNVDEEDAQLRDALKECLEECRSLCVRLDGRGTILKALLAPADLEKLKAASAKLDEAVKSIIEKEFFVLAVKVQEMDGKVDELSGKMDNLEGKMGDLESVVQELKVRNLF